MPSTQPGPMPWGSSTASCRRNWCSMSPSSWRRRSRPTARSACRSPSACCATPGSSMRSGAGQTGPTPRSCSTARTPSRGRRPSSRSASLGGLAGSETYSRPSTSARYAPASEDAMGRVVTISATYGAGGTVVAPRVAERLGLPFADRLIAARGGDEAPGEQLSEQEREESRRRGFLDRLAHLTGGLGLPVPEGGDLQSPVRRQVEASIAQLSEGGAVILGRGAAIVLAGDPDAFHVRLDGPAEA